MHAKTEEKELLRISWHLSLKVSQVLLLGRWTGKKKAVVPTYKLLLLRSTHVKPCLSNLSSSYSLTYTPPTHAILCVCSFSQEAWPERREKCSRI